MMSAAQMTAHQPTGEAAIAVGKASPGLAVTGAMLAGIPLETWVAIATLVYLLVQISYSTWKWVREMKAKKGPADV